MVVLGSEIVVKSGIKWQKMTTIMFQLFLSLCCFATLQAQQLQPSYTVVAPKIVRPNSDFLVAVSLYNTDDEAASQDVTLVIRGRSDSGQTIEIRQETTVTNEETQIVRIKIGDLGEGKYTLSAKGSFPIAFDQIQELTYIHKGYSVFIQTDKSVYRPGNLVQFRAVVVDQRLKPSVVGSIDVSMHDGNGNLIKKWDRVFTTKGVFAASIKLADSPVHGDWNITVDVSGQLFHQSFLVAEYILPKFDVEVIVPEYGRFSDSVSARVRASYSHGGPVKGEATISVFPRYKSGTLQPVFDHPVRRVVDIAGQIDIEFKELAKDLALNQDFARQIVFDVQVKEDNTERIENNTAVYTMFKYKHKLQLVKTADAFKPGMQYTAFLKVAFQDNTPVQDDLNEVAVRWGFDYNPSNYNTTNYKIPEDGIIELTFDPPGDLPPGSVLGIEAQYKGNVQWFSSIPSAVARSSNYMLARLRTELPTVGGNIRVGISTTEAPVSFTYVVFGRGRLVFAETLKGSGTVYNEINFRASATVSPRCRILVYYVSTSGQNGPGEVIADSLEFEVGGTFETGTLGTGNFVDVSASRQQQLPGKDITINVKSKPDSFVGILGVDMRVNALNQKYSDNRNDITLDTVVKELRTYDSGRDPNFYPWFSVIKPKEDALSWHTGSSASKQTFEDSGTVILTNGDLPSSGRRNNDNAVVQVEYHGENRPFGRPIPKPGVDTINPDKGPALEYEVKTRPNLAGPYAFSKIPEPVDNLPKIYLRKDLPNTWLFMNATTDIDGKASIPVKAPDTANTSFVMTAFALNDLHGMGISERLATLQVFQPFFVKVALPYSVRKGETLAVQMVVYNYMPKEISAEVTLENTPTRAFIFGTKSSNEIDDGSGNIELYKTKRVQVRPKRGTLISFLITPQEVGLLDLKITATSSIGKDILIKQLRVEPEGETVYVNKAVFLDLRKTDIAERNVSIAIPRSAIKGSGRVFVSAGADLVGPAMNNLRQLIHYPLGCGEQNILHLLPPVIVSDYLEEAGVFSPLEESARALMEESYQKQLNYRHNTEGSFSAFGPSVDDGGSIWITALTVSTLRRAQRFIDADEDVVQGGFTWLINQQNADGSFKETGRITNGILQESDLAMTAFVVLAFIDNKRNLNSASRNSLNRGINYIAERWESIDAEQDTYTLAIVTYALHQANHPQKDGAFRLLDSVAKTDTEGKKWWENALEDFEKENPWTTAPNSANIQMTSYALLSIISRIGEKGGSGISDEDAFPVLEWLLQQQNSNGGFASTIDTNVAITALKEMSKKLKLTDRNSKVVLQYTYLNTVRSMKVDSNKPTVMQKRILPSETKEVKLRAKGSGFALLQVGYEFNVDVNAAWPSFVVNPQVFPPSTQDHLQVSACANFIHSAGGESGSSNMAVMEVNLPSGFTANTDSLPALRRYRGVRRVDTEKENTKIILYFETLGRGELCPTISAYRTSRVANQKPASVVVYDYYDQTRRARSFYESPRATLCDICDPATSDQCPDDGCPDRPTPSFSTRYSTFEGDVDVLGSHCRSLVPLSLVTYLSTIITTLMYRVLIG